MGAARQVAVGVAAVAAVLAGCGTGARDDTGPAASTGEAAAIERGERLFEANCAVCHGTAARGTVQGPPLVHVIYEPGHHSDEAFQLAVARGVVPHHWSFGPMPPVPGLSREDVAAITAYVRALQREAGIID